MLRLEFSAVDLGRVRVASTPHPLWELVLAINSLQAANLPSRYWGWRADLQRARCQDAGLSRLLIAATAIIPASGSFPDILTPPIDDRDVEAHLDTMLAVPPTQLREDLSRTFRTWSKAPRWAQSLYRHGRLESLAELLRQTHALLVKPVDPVVLRRVEADRARHARLVLEGGTEHLLANLHSSIRWRSPVLESDYPVDRTVDLAGRGLVVTPTYFCWGAPVTFIDPGRTPVLVIPASAPGDLTTTPACRLDRLIGTTRARLLAELVNARSTSELATRLNVSQAAISQHTKVLRETKLIITARSGMSVRHSLTSLGRELLQS